MIRSLLVLVVCSSGLACASVATAREPRPQPMPPAKVVPPVEAETLAKTFRELLLKNLPDPALQTAPGWGNQKDTLVAVKYHKDGLRIWTEQIREPRNDGTWRRVTVRIPDGQSVVVSVSEISNPEPGKLLLTTAIAADCDLKFEQQVWKNGLRLFSGETRGRCKSLLVMKVEATTRTEFKPNSLLPELVLRIKVTDAQLTYSDLVVVHTVGVGGDAAKLIGEALINTVKFVKPNLENELLEKANAAIVKAADTKEVRVALNRLFISNGPK